jgi:hypothetical protein
VVVLVRHTQRSALTLDHERPVAPAALSCLKRSDSLTSELPSDRRSRVQSKRNCVRVIARSC